MSVPNLPSLPHPPADGATREYMQHLVNALDYAIEQLNRGEPIKNNVLDNLASGDNLEFDGETWRNIVPKFRSFASCYISSSALTTINTINVWEKAAGTTTDVTINDYEGKTISTVDNRLKYIGTRTLHVHAACSFSASSVSPNKTFEYSAWHYDDSAASGSILDQATMIRRHGSSDTGTGAIHFDIMLDTNDYVEFHVRNTTDATNVTIDKMYLALVGMG